jgi:hypothetical protein
MNKYMAMSERAGWLPAVNFCFCVWADSRVEAGSNTSTVALRVGGGDKKGRLEFETVKYGHQSHGTRTRESMY